MNKTGLHHRPIRLLQSIIYPNRNNSVLKTTVEKKLFSACCNVQISYQRGLSIGLYNVQLLVGQTVTDVDHDIPFVHIVSSPVISSLRFSVSSIIRGFLTNQSLGVFGV